MGRGYSSNGFRVTTRDSNTPQCFGWFGDSRTRTFTDLATACPRSSAGSVASVLWSPTIDCNGNAGTAGNAIITYNSESRSPCQVEMGCHTERKTRAQCQEICAGMANCAGYSYWAGVSALWGPGEHTSCVLRSASCPNDSERTCETPRFICFFKKPQANTQGLAESDEAEVSELRQTNILLKEALQRLTEA